MSRVRGDAGPLIASDGRVLVDARKCPALHRALEASARWLREERAEWVRVAELRVAGQSETADRVARKLLGVQGPPMPEEKKAELREWREAHKEEIAERAKLKRLLRRRTLALLTTGRRRR